MKAPDYVHPIVSAYRGQIVGEVLGSRPLGNTRGLKPDDRRRRAAWTRLRLDEPVGKGDLLELRHDDEFDQFLTCLAPEDTAAGSIIECRTARHARRSPRAPYPQPGRARRGRGGT